MQIFPSKEEFESKKNNHANQIVWTRLSADFDTPVSLASKLKDSHNFCALFESVEKGRYRARYSFITIDPDLIFKCEKGKGYLSQDAKNFTEDGEVFSSLRKLINNSQINLPEELPQMSAGIFGYMGYDMVRYMEKLPCNNPDVINIPESLFIRPGIIIIFDSVKDELIITAPVYKGTGYDEAKSRIEEIVKEITEKNVINEHKSPNPKAGLGEIKSNITQEQYHHMVEKAKEYILAGDIFQVVPSQRFTVEFPYDAFDLYRSLRRLNPSPYSFYMKMDNFALVGSSPEILVKVKDQVATVRPIAGTRKRGKNEAEDKALAEDLLSDEKEIAEHLMLIDLGRNDIGRIAKTGSVRVTEEMVIEYYSHVMHIVSNVEGDLREDLDALDAVIAGFPVGTVSGAPKIRAMEIIDELETQKRSFYAGGVGYFGANGDVDMCIALRTGLVKDNKLYIQAGGGVVADSDPEFEYQESCNKAKALLTAAEEVASKN